MNPKPNNKRTFLIIAIMVVAVLVLAIILTNTMKVEPEVLSYDALVGKVKEGKVEALYFDGDYIVNVLYTKDSETSNEDYAKRVADFKNGKYKDATAVITYRNNFVLALENLQKDGAISDMPEIWLNNPSEGSFWSYVPYIISIVGLIGIAIFFFVMLRKQGGGGNAMSFGKTKSKAVDKVKVRFTDVAGAEEEKQELKEIVEFLKQPKKFKEIGAKIPKGVLLVGPPGTGKTLFAKAVAGEANVPFFSISGSDFVEMFVGVGASRVRDLFAQAKKSQPCIVFIDEIDAVGRKRGAGLGGGNDEREQTLNQLLVQMDGFEENEAIVIMAATNRADVLDPALLRPGRFDRQIYVNLPDVRGREAIFRVHARNKPLSPEIDFKNLARLTTGFSGADIANLLNEAAIIAARENRKIISMVDILEGINKVIAGPQKRSRVVTEKDKRITAYHEAGHALVGRVLKNCDAVQEVSIIPRGRAAGYTISRPKSDDAHTTLSHLHDTIAMTMGGRAAEELIIRDITTGASQDIKHATSIARSMVTEWGMSPELRNVYFGGEQEVFIGRDYQTQASYSDEVAGIIDAEIRKIVDNAYDRALATIKENEDKLHVMVALLFQHETIYGDEVDLIMEGKSAEEITAYIEDKKAKREAEAKAKAEEAKRTQNPLGNPKDFIVSEEPTITISEPIILEGNIEETSTEPEKVEPTEVDTPTEDNQNNDKE